MFLVFFLLQPQVLSCWPPPILGRSPRRQSRGRAAQTLEPPTTTDSAGSEARATSRCSVPVWATESAVRSGVSVRREGRKKCLSRREISLSAPDSCHHNQIALTLLYLPSALPLLSFILQRPETRRTVETPTVSLACSRSSSWERPTTPAPQTDAQMGSSGALQAQTMRRTSSTLSVLRGTVRLRNRDLQSLSNLP